MNLSGIPWTANFDDRFLVHLFGCSSAMISARRAGDSARDVPQHAPQTNKALRKSERPLEEYRSTYLGRNVKPLS